VGWKLGQAAVNHLDGFDILFRSPGWPLNDPPIEEARQQGVQVTSPMRLFFKLCPTGNTVGVTGTKGKGTTASLISHILKQAGQKVWLGGNIGVAPFTFLDKIRANDWVVLELSSFQLEDMDTSPHIGVITNFYKEHLAAADPRNRNYHPTLAAYWLAKLNIVRWQKRGDRAIINSSLKARLEKEGLRSKIIYFSRSEYEMKLPGAHNRENLAAAAEAVRIAGVRENVIKQAAASFQGLPYRLERVRQAKGVEYYNDSFATTPESAITALKAFSSPIVLIAGGAEKNSDFRHLAREIKRRAKFTVLLDGKATPRLRKELLRVNYPASRMKKAGSMAEAVRIARTKTESGDVVLMSPACASFGMFDNYKQRGDEFRKAVRKYK
jgi:UDP-N-acetylmuramoylalanine--D-glutamate ligase